MSADPDTAFRPTLISGGYVVKNMVYSSDEAQDRKTLLCSRGADGPRELDQYTIPPYSVDMPRNHPCYNVNENVEKCNQKIEPQVLLAGRIAMCNDERRVLMQCLTKNKNWGRAGYDTKAVAAAKKSGASGSDEETTKPWYKLW
eukprot:PhM_4_TR1409/c0_g1_i1/m.70307